MTRLPWRDSKWGSLCNGQPYRAIVDADGREVALVPGFDDERTLRLIDRIVGAVNAQAALTGDERHD